tara:strand:- start:8069 stop:8569 length:501 start_codon:yes stop_codon:yes gene_type:complete
MDEFYGQFQILNQNWGWPSNDTGSYEDLTHAPGLGAPWQGITDCLMRSLYLCQDPSYRGGLFLLDTLKRPLTIGWSPQWAFEQYMAACGSYFTANETGFQTALRYLREHCTDSPHKCGYLCTLEWCLHLSHLAKADDIGTTQELEQHFRGIMAETLEECDCSEEFI